MKLSMTLIAKNEAKNIKSCFDSWWDHVDEVVLVDDGSTDATIQAAQAYAKDKMQKDKLVVERFREPSDEPTNNFAALRNRADELATGDWRVWCDLDDEIVGLDRLRKVVEEGDPSIYQYYAMYEYAFDNAGVCFCQLWRERLVRADAPTEGWTGRIHEAQMVPPPMGMVGSDIAIWKHNRHEHTDLSRRNEKLLWEWVEEEPGNARALSYLAFELMAKRVEVEGPDNTKTTAPDIEALRASIPMFQEYLAIPGESPEMRAQSTRRLAQVLMMLGLYDEAYQVSVPMLAEAPQWPDTKLTLAEVAHERKDWMKTIEFCNQVLKQGAPDTMLITNPTDYTWRPMVLMASALSEMGQLEEAVKAAQEVAKYNPTFMNIGASLQGWGTQLGHEQAATTWSSCAQMLVSYDEPEKAEALLETAPFFICTHPKIIAAKVMVAGVLIEPYQVEKIEGNGRGNFIVRGLKKMAEENDKRAAEIKQEQEREEAEEIKQEQEREEAEKRASDDAQTANA